MRKVIPFIVIFLLLIVIKNNISSITHTIKNKNTAEVLKSQLNEEERENKLLKERLFYVKTNQFVEDEARQKLGMLRSGEYIVIAPTSAPLNKERIYFDSTPNWEKWLDLFF